MPQVKVWNKNQYPFSQDFKGTKISIPANKFILMDYDEAIEFAGTFYPPGEERSPKNYKMIKVDRPDSPTEEVVYVCPITKQRFDTMEAFQAHLQQYSDQVHTDHALEAQIKAAEEVAKRPRGRPRKEQKEASA